MFWEYFSLNNSNITSRVSQKIDESNVDLVQVFSLFQSEIIIDMIILKFDEIFRWYHDQFSTFEQSIK